HSGFVIWMLDDNDCMLQWNKMEKKHTCERVSVNEHLRNMKEKATEAWADR
ncbi:604_t:CDS:2, partial [Ambispora gerdemannii]